MHAATPFGLIERVAIAQAVVDRFNGRPFDWGRDDCARMAAFVLRKRGRPVKLAKAGSYYSARGALKALKRTGFANLTLAVDGQGLRRIAPAAVLPCDFIGLPADDGGDWLALSVALGGGRVIAFTEGYGRIGQLRDETLFQAIAWRVD